MSMTAGVTPAGTGEGGIVWSILGQTYKPLAHSESCFAFDTRFPPGTFVPPHNHTNQDEFIRVLEGQFDLFLDGQAATAKAGDLIRLPMGQPPGIFNKSGADVRPLFCVSPSRKLSDLFSPIRGLPDPAEVAPLSAACEVPFLPPPA